MSEPELKRYRLWRWVTLFVLAAAVLAFGLVWRGAMAPAPEVIFDRFVQGTRASSSVRLMQGLPRPGTSRISMQEEIKGHKTIRARGHYFYEEPLSQGPALMDQVVSLTLDWRFTHPVEGVVKYCGNFHPDYMLEWTRDDGRKYQLMLCFGCGEAKLFNGNLELHCTLTKDKEIRALLDDQHQNRPEENAIRSTNE